MIGQSMKKTKKYAAVIICRINALNAKIMNQFQIEPRIQIDHDFILAQRIVGRSIIWFRK